MLDACAKKNVYLDQIFILKEIFYTVHVYIEESIAKEWQDWMIRVHIPDVMRTRCFDGSQISALIEPEKGGYKGFQIQYNTTSDRFATYQLDFAARLQKEHTEKYAGRFIASRFITEKI